MMIVEKVASREEAKLDGLWYQLPDGQFIAHREGRWTVMYLSEAGKPVSIDVFDANWNPVTDLFPQRSGLQ